MCSVCGHDLDHAHRPDKRYEAHPYAESRRAYLRYIDALDFALLETMRHRTRRAGLPDAGSKTMKLVCNGFRPQRFHLGGRPCCARYKRAGRHRMDHPSIPPHPLQFRSDEAS